ncbi:hypothetical protein B0T19DRAFT_212791 [Cercophora scortea]|uniref:Uncharacterized protein n=1 Tax=Cercophora scortea TaxID=314031 RepID=A0AAE0MAB6_9PEZI|nr:hypothetical protein B0T19DRAFT_212791 [Cercophora scortea]
MEAAIHNPQSRERRAREPPSPPVLIPIAPLPSPPPPANHLRLTDSHANDHTIIFLFPGSQIIHRSRIERFAAATASAAARGFVAVWGWQFGIVDDAWRAPMLEVGKQCKCNLKAINNLHAGDAHTEPYPAHYPHRRAPLPTAISTHPVTQQMARRNRRSFGLLPRVRRGLSAALAPYHFIRVTSQGVARSATDQRVSWSFLARTHTLPSQLRHILRNGDPRRVPGYA